MTGQLLLVSTCGTSVLTNEADPEERKWLTGIANEATLSQLDEEHLACLVTKRKDRLLTGDPGSRRLSAELSSIDAILDKWHTHRVQHLLLHTDTAAGQAAAHIVEAVLQKDGSMVELLTAPGLRTNDFPSFREALADVTKQLEERVPGYRQKGWTTLFNLTGGFKSVNAYLQALGMLYADRCVFLFEGSPTLMEIPRLPIRLAEADEISEHLTAFRKLKSAYPVAEKEVVDIPDSLLLLCDGQVTTSIWGDVVWGRVRKKLLGETLLEPLSPKLKLSDAVYRAFNKLNENRRIQVNEALDVLSAHLDLGHDFPKSKTFKRLQGNPVPPATHELYLWSDASAWRLYGHFEGDRFIADCIGAHL